MNKMKEQIEELEKEIEIEQMDYDICCKYPTETNLFYEALSRQQGKLIEKRHLLRELKLELTNPNY